MDINRAFEVLNGLDISPSEGVDGPFYTGGPMSPVGLNLPTRTFYVQNDPSNKVKVWLKFGAGVNDWRELSAEDIPFNPANAENITATNLQDLGEQLANRPFGKDFAESTAEFNDSTTGGSFKIFDIFNFNVSDTSGVNKYRVESNFFWGHNSASNDIRVQLLVDGNLVYEMRKEPKDPGGDQRIDGLIKGYVQNLSQGSHSITLQYRPATASRVSSMYRSCTEVWRVE